MMMPELDDHVRRVVEAWISWVPRWSPGSHKTRTRVCRTCFGSPIIAAAGLDRDVPHAVQHALATRIKRLISSAVDAYAEQHLVHLSRALREMTHKKSRQLYRPREGLAPEYEGLDLDPDPADPAAPFLFTISELEEQSAAEAGENSSPEWNEGEKREVRRELVLADEFARGFGDAVCVSLMRHQPVIRQTIDDYVEPHIAAVVEELARELSVPGLSRVEAGATTLFADVDYVP